MKRRELLAAMPAGALAALSGGCVAQTDASGKNDAQENSLAQGEAIESARKLSPFGLQLSTLTPLLVADFEGTLAQVASIGYQQVEFSALGFLGRPVSMVADLLAEYELDAPVGRISPKLPDGFARLSRQEQMAAFRTLSSPEHLLDNVRYALGAVRELGQKDLILPALMPDNFSTLANVEASIELLRRAGELCGEQGIRFGYHNHDWEFKPVAGVVPYDLMLQTIDPELMAFQLDVYWVTKGGRDPLAYLADHAGRFPSCHLKDIDDNGDFADVGHGNIDFPAFVAAAVRAGTRHYFVERDNPPDPLLSARQSYAFLQQMNF